MRPRNLKKLSDIDLLLEFYRAQIEVWRYGRGGRAEKTIKYRRVRQTIFEHITDKYHKQEVEWMLKT